jgi:hypothetical protein
MDKAGLMKKLNLTKNFKEFIQNLKLRPHNPMIKYYSSLFDEVLYNAIPHYLQRGKLKMEYNFKHHFRLLFENDSKV